MTKPALHVSMMSMLSKCGLMFKYRYIDGIVSPPGIALTIGKAVDLAGSDNALHKMAHGEGRSGEEMRDIAATMFEGAWEGEEPALTPEEKAKGRAAVKGETKDQAVELAALEADEMLPAITPLSVQRRRRLVLDGFPFDVEGTSDIEEPDAIHDRKTAAKSPSADIANGNVQLNMYAMLRSVSGEPPADKVVYNALVKNKKPKYVRVEAPAIKDFAPILRRLEAAAHVIDSGAFMPVDPTSPSGWTCCAKWCSYWQDDCPFGRRARVTVPMSTQE